MTRLVLAACTFLGACAPTDTEAPAFMVDPRWPVVSQMLGARCGSLDCHGQTGRPLRLYHGQGLRLDGVPGEGSTTAAEHDANLRTTLGLEPEVIARVLAEDGEDPARLTLYRKARGLEKHKGEAPLSENDPGAVCLRSWLKGDTDVTACEDGARPGEAP